MNTFHTNCVETEHDDRGVVTIWFDSPGRTVNVFDETMLKDFELTLTRLEQSILDTRLILLRSRKPRNFFAGADVNRIAAVSSGEELEEILRRGQQVFARVERLSVPTVAVIEGACMGGGMELALACSFRIANNDRATKMGLPEIHLGVIPGWGGTQRLPQLIGHAAALPLVLQGKALSPADALRCGLVDRVIGNTSAVDSLPGFVREILAGAVPRRPKTKRSIAQKLLDGTRLGRWLVQRAALHRTRGEARNYPAFQEAIKAVHASFDSKTDGFAFERAAFGRLLFTPVCRNLLEIFLGREAARRPSTWIGNETKQDRIESVAIIGAGAMGAGIGLVAATHGYQVVLKEVDETLATAGRKRIADMIHELVSKGRLTASDRQALASRITVAADWDCLAHADLVVEAIVEKLSVKQQVFEQLDKILPGHVLLTSNTSSLSVQAMSSSTHRPGQVAGLHFFNPVHRMELVEIVKSEVTSSKTIAQLVGFVRSLGKTPIVTKDSPGFLVNRVLFPYLAEAIRMVGEGMNPQAIDGELRTFGMPMGPLELLDQVGLDVAAHVSHSLPGMHDDADTAVRLLDSLVAQGQLGKKTGSGFYRYKGGKIVANSESCAEWVQKVNPPLSAVKSVHSMSDGLTSVQRRLIYPLLNEAVRCLDEAIVHDPWMVDLAMVLGVGFAPFRGGPLATIDTIGTEFVLANMRWLSEAYGQRFAPAAGLVSMFYTGGKFHGPLRSNLLTDGVLT